MAFRKTLSQRLLNMTKVSSQALINCRISSSSVIGKVSPRATEPDDPGENGLLRSPHLARNLLDNLWTMGVARNRIRLEGLTPPPPPPPQIPGGMVDTLTVEDARKVLKFAQVETMKSKLRETRKSCITFSEFIGICAEYCSDQDRAVDIAKMLDDSAAVVVLGDVVFLRPEQEIETMLFRKI